MAKVSTLESQRRKVAEHLHRVGFYIAGFQICEAEEIEDGFNSFCNQPDSQLVVFVGAPCHGFGDNAIEAFGSFRDFTAVNEVERSFVPLN